MKLILTLFAISSIAISSNAQGSWDMGYLEIDSIDSTDIGKSVKLDFKTEGLDKPRSIRTYIAREDDGEIIVDGNTIKVFEKRKIYVDHGSFSDQFLELESSETDQQRVIYQSELLEIEPESLKFMIQIDTYKTTKKKRGDKLGAEKHFVWVDRDLLDGLIVKREK